jgi:hypothetical protein
MKELGAKRGASINAVLRTVENEAKGETGAAQGEGAAMPDAARTFGMPSNPPL